MTDSCQIVRHESFEGLKKNWKSLLRKSPATTFFQEYDWLSSWWKFYGSPSELCILLCIKENEIIGIAPLMVKRVARKRIPKKVLSFIGTGVSDYLDFIVKEDHEEMVLFEFFKYIKEHRKEWDVVELFDVPQTSKLNLLISDLANRAGLVSYTEETSFCPYICLPSSWEEFLASLRSHSRSNMKRKAKLLRNKSNIKFEKASSIECQRYMKDFLDLHEKRRSAKGSEPLKENFKKFMVEISQRLSDQINLTFLNVDGRLLAGMLTFDYHDSRNFYLVGWEPDSEILSPGHNLIQNQLQDAMKKGIHTFDFLRGDENYKYDYTRLQRTNRDHRLFGSRSELKSYLLIKKIIVKVSQYVSRSQRRH